jgi:hypothetical protein
VRSRLFGLKRNVPQPFAGHDEPRALGLAGHDETLSRLRRWRAVGDKPNLLGILGTPSVTSGPQSTASRIRSPQSNPCHLLALRNSEKALKDGPRQQQNCTDRYEEKARPVWSEP